DIFSSLFGEIEPHDEGHKEVTRDDQPIDKMQGPNLLGQIKSLEKTFSLCLYITVFDPLVEAFLESGSLPNPI
ncbi:MAG: hypothetical protein KC978_25145, partial [Candidatus Omnitrophica bacterium]|nr:hypothetical protein [Candidatus Omnitrophota bacterium]